MIKICSIEGCGKKHKARGYCSAHVSRIYKGKDPNKRTRNSGNEIITDGDVSWIVMFYASGEERARAIIDTSDLEKVRGNKWRVIGRNMVATHRLDGSNIFLHRIINNTPDGYDTDHINGNCLDNRKCNLRTATHLENCRNSRAISKTSKYKGVCWDNTKRKWLVAIKFSEKPKFIGHFLDEVDAAVAYDNMAIKHFGEFAKLNFPLGG